MAYEHILLDRDEHVAIVTLNRPEKFNALNPVLWEEIIQIGEDLRQIQYRGIQKQLVFISVSYTHLTLPTSDLV